MGVKQRLSASIDADLMLAGQQIVAAGRAESLSAWVNAALWAEVERDQRLQALSEFVATFESEHGQISAAEIVAANRAARERALVARGGTS